MIDKKKQIDWKNDKGKIYRCKICNKWTKDIWCDYCKEKLEIVRIVIKKCEKTKLINQNMNH
jgi:hypothetical protein